MRLIKSNYRTAAISDLLSGDAERHQGTILLEELLAAGVSQADYDAWLIDIYKGDQFESGFVDLNPNSKIQL
jgi:GST-like protein